jgi:hypothetical protein
MFHKLLFVSLFAFNFVFGLGKFYDVNLYFQSKYWEGSNEYTYWEKASEWKWNATNDKTKQESILNQLRGKFLIDNDDRFIKNPENSLFLGLTQTKMIFPVKNMMNIVGFAQIAQKKLPQLAYYTTEDVKNNLPYTNQTKAYKDQNNITSYPQAYIFFKFNGEGKCTKIIASRDRDDAQFLVFF